MKVKSLGYRTHLFFPAFDGEMLDRGEYLVVRTPSNAEYYWGNFLLFAGPPEEGDFERWRGLFAREIGAPPETKHQVFGWDAPDGEPGAIQPFLKAGFRLLRDVVMTSREPHGPPRPAEGVQVRALQSDADWEQALENQVAGREPEFTEAEYRSFRQGELARYRAMAAAGRGDWYGAFIGERLVADLGLFHADGLGRYQSVETHPDFRRRGIAGTLVCDASRLAMAKYNLHTLVIVAETDSSAARIYASLGFEATEVQVGLEWWPGIESWNEYFSD